MRILLALLLSLSLAPALAAPSLTVDLNSGRVLQAEQAFDPWHPASLTKLMTAYTVFRAIASGRVALDSPVTITREATRQPPSKMGYGRGTVMTIENALKLSIIKSANDVSLALAQSVGGSEAGFARMMNDASARLGMTGSNWVNPHGLHDARQVTSARDMALLLRALHAEFPQYGEWFSAPSVIAPKKTSNGKTIKRVYFSYNLLLERFAGADGYKTGFVCASGYNFAGAATRNGRRLAAIVLGRDGQTSRAVDAARMLTEGFQQAADAGVTLADLQPEGTPAKAPRNMRAEMCSEAARAARYDPGAGQAVIDSPYLTPRAIVRGSLEVALGGATGPAPVTFANVPLPSPRPAFTPEPMPGIDGLVASAAGSSITLPTFRPGLQ